VSAPSSPARSSRLACWTGGTGYYTAKLILNLVLLAAGGAAIAAPEDSWWQLLTAAYLAVVFTQLALVGHDAGHRQIFRSRRANNLVGLVQANLLVGISFGWWVGKHDRALPGVHVLPAAAAGGRPNKAVRPFGFRLAEPFEGGTTQCGRRKGAEGSPGAVVPALVVPAVDLAHGVALVLGAVDFQPVGHISFGQVFGRLLGHAQPRS
jgi:hypothetical protein